MKEVICHNCEYGWNYKGNSQYYATCPNCCYKVFISRSRLLKTCVNCKKSFSKIHEHHISYETDTTVRVCESCHRNIHNDKGHLLYPIDTMVKTQGDKANEKRHSKE